MLSSQVSARMRASSAFAAGFGFSAGGASTVTALGRFFGFGGSGFGAASSSAFCSAKSGVYSTVSSSARRSCSEGSGLPGCSACFWAASVALNSSASGPSRMLARFRAIEDLLREIAVRLGGVSGRVVLEDACALHRRFCVANGLADARLEHEVAEALLQDLDRLARVERAAVEH